MPKIYKDKIFAEQCARNLRCSGVKTAYVKEIVAYEVITGSNMNSATFQDHYEMWLHENKKIKEEWSYERWIEEYCFKDFGKKVKK